MTVNSLEDAITALDSPMLEKALDRRSAALERMTRSKSRRRVIRWTALLAAVTALSIALIVVFANRASDPFSRMSWPGQYAEYDVGVGFAKESTFGRVKFVKEDGDLIVLGIEKTNDEPIYIHFRGINSEKNAKSKWAVASSADLSDVSGYENLKGALELSVEGKPVRTLPTAAGAYLVTVSLRAFRDAGYDPYDFAVGTEKDQVFFLLGAEKRFIGETYKKGVYVDLTTIYSEKRDETTFRFALSVDPAWNDYDRSLQKIWFSCADVPFVSGSAFGRELERVKLNEKDCLLFDPTLPDSEYRDQVLVHLTVKGRIERDRNYSFDLYYGGTEEENADLLRLYVNSVEYRDFYDVYARIGDLDGADALCLPRFENAIPVNQVVCRRNEDKAVGETPSVDDYDSIEIEYKMSGEEKYKKFIYTISKTDLLPEGGEKTVFEQNGVRYTVHKDVNFRDEPSLFFEKDGYHYRLREVGVKEFDAQEIINDLFC